MSRRCRLELALFAAVLLVYLASPIATPFDSRWTIYTAESLIHQHNLDLNEYRTRLHADHYYSIECIPAPGQRVYPLPWGAEDALRACPGGRLYNFYPVAVPILAAPLVGALEGSLHLARPLLEPLIRATPPGYRRSLLEGDLVAGSMPAELIIASLITALAAVVVFRIARRWTSWPVALVVALIFAFGSPAWSTGSRALWQHTFSMLLLPLALDCLLERRVAWAGAILMLAFFVRPTNVVPLCVAGLWMLALGRRETLRFIAGTLPVGLVFAGLNWQMYGSWLAPYFRTQRTATTSLGLHAHIGEALLGDLFSPARGLFVFSPVFLLSLVGMWLWIRQRSTRLLGLFMVAVFAGHYILIACFEEWYGGHSYGPRYFADLAPYLALAIVPVWTRLGRLAQGSILALALLSVFIHSQGATCAPCLEWNSKPVELHENLGRLWDWRDPPFLRGLR